ncbi:MAG TPA: flagellar basal-body MS-ring/collar protein FliF [Candidatus Cloacimonadota bacterium]|nr:flagellar basal-body MS-ring/collar protein FliF [Candidatus Cloacimonadota bacterium]HOQ80157.1 flagellar basal-body MS-ring/collar protein FliF [Candidatus Cloacimonadota bacterium]HPK41302.1 flagellar basal-body MS-ring/collar protein FliF [Candidatus Cloacimonadota bacterium]
MKDKFNHVASKFKDVYLRMELRQRVLLAVLLVLTITVIVWLISWSTKVEYSLLFAKLSPEDAQTVITKLDEQKIPYNIKENGTAIYIPADKVPATRINLASESIGAKSQGIGFEIFDKTQLGTTEFQQKINYRRAMEGELQRTIMSIAGVEYVRVHLVFPEEKIFKEDQEDPSASVMINTKQRLSEKQITGISNLISSAIEGLDPARVTIVDQNGKILTEAFDDGVTGLSNKQLRIQTEYENKLSLKVQSMLDQILGVNNSVVRVTAELNFDQVETTVEKYDPEGQVVRSEELESNNLTNMKDDITNTSEHQITNYEINSTVQKIINQTGSVKRMTVAVNVNYKTKIEEKDGKTVKEYTERSPEEILGIQALVQNTVGFDAERGDQLVVNSTLFDNTEIELQKSERDKEIRNQKLIDMGEKAFVIIILIVLIIVLIRQFKKIFAVPEAEIAEMEELRPAFAEGVGVGEGFYHEGEEGMPMGEGKISYTYKPMKDIEIEQTEAILLQEAIQKFIIENPDVAVRLIKSWLIENNPLAALHQMQKK